MTRAFGAGVRCRTGADDEAMAARAKSVLKSFLLERLALELLQTWSNNQRDHFWYDWMVRDFFGYLIGRANGYIFMPGTNEAIALGDDWLYQARRAYKHAVTACEHEHSNYGILAGQEWQAIFGSAIPLCSFFYRERNSRT